MSEAVPAAGGIAIELTPELTLRLFPIWPCIWQRSA